MPEAAAIGFVSGALCTLFIRRMTNPDQIRLALNAIVACIFEFRLFPGQPAVLFKAQWRLIQANARLLRLLAVPSLILLLPCWGLLEATEGLFGHVPLKPGESAVVTVPYRGALPNARLDAPAGFAVETPAVRIPRLGQISWRVRALRPVSGQFVVHVDGRTLAVHAPERQTNWLLWFGVASFAGAVAAGFLNFRRSLALVLLACAGCARPSKDVIVLGVDGMDPSFVERHWNELPNLRRLRDQGSFQRLATTIPAQSPVAWSTLITGLDPDQHGIFDFVHRDAATLQPFSSLSKTEDSRYRLSLGSFSLPLSDSKVISLRRGTPFWQTLSQHGIPVTVIRMPTNYPPVQAGHAISGMGTPDLDGTLGTFTFYTDDAEEVAGSVSGGNIVKIHLENGHAALELMGPPNSLRKDHAPTEAALQLDVDPENPAARFESGDDVQVLKEGEWSRWIAASFPLIPHLASVSGTFRVFVKQLHPSVKIYVSPINIDPMTPALPVSSPPDWSRQVASETGRFFTLGIPEDTSALRQNVLTLAEFKSQARLVSHDEQTLLRYSLNHFSHGFLFFYFSSIDQNSHILWGRHEPDLLKVYQEVDESIGEVMKQRADAELIVMSDHGFSRFDRAVHLNTWLNHRGFLSLSGRPGDDTSLNSIAWANTKAYAVGLNGLYLNLSGRELHGVVPYGQQSSAIVDELRKQLVAWRDPSNGKQVVEAVYETKADSDNAAVAPDLIVGYAPGYRASWQTALGGTPEDEIQDNMDDWIADHCINPVDVPGVLFTNRRQSMGAARIQDVTAMILKLYGLAPEPLHQ
jgi:predicted AlkP superfamily phosphohydrolase/phosphomutase